MTWKTKHNEIKIESFRCIVVQQRVSRIEILEIPREPVEVKRVRRGVEFLRAIDPVEIEPCSVEIIEIGVQFERCNRLGEHRVIKVLSRAGQFAEHVSFLRGSSFCAEQPTPSSLRRGNRAKHGLHDNVDCSPWLRCVLCLHCALVSFWRNCCGVITARYTPLVPTAYTRYAAAGSLPWGFGMTLAQFRRDGFAVVRDLINHE